jgi:hypothetical protein
VYRPVSIGRKTASISFDGILIFKHVVHYVMPAVTRESRVISHHFQTTRLPDFFLAKTPSFQEDHS